LNIQKLIEESIVHSQALICKAFNQQWREKTRKQTLKRLEREKTYNIIADRFAAKYIPKRCVRIWLEFVKSQKDQRWREFRKEMLRESVKVF
jgi:hypothetical protein